MLTGNLTIIRRRMNGYQQWQAIFTPSPEKATHGLLFGTCRPHRSAHALFLTPGSPYTFPYSFPQQRIDRMKAQSKL